MKDAARLLAYFVATLLFGALAAPILYWFAQWLIAHGTATFAARYDFETYFHRALLIGALLFAWPLLRSLGIKSWRDLDLAPNRRPVRDVSAGFFLATVPLLCFGVALLMLGIYTLRSFIPILPLFTRSLSALIVPLFEEPIFRGLILGVLLRSSSKGTAILVSSALFSILHFLKAPEGTSAVVTWTSVFQSIGHSFSQFHEPVLVLAGFTTLLVIGLILADARILTRSLWLPIGLHAGWIFANATFNKLAHREMEALPWIGRNLLIGLAPLVVALLSWGLMRAWLKYVEHAKT